MKLEPERTSVGLIVFRDTSSTKDVVVVTVRGQDWTENTSTSQSYRTCSGLNGLVHGCLYCPFDGYLEAIVNPAYSENFLVPFTIVVPPARAKSIDVVPANASWLPLDISAHAERSTGPTDGRNHEVSASSQ